MKVLHVIDDDRPIGGAQTYLHRLVPALEAAGHESVVLVGPTDTRAALAAHPAVVLVHTIDSALLVRRFTEIAPTIVYEHDYRHISPGNSRFFVRSERFCERGFGAQCLLKPYTQRCNNRRPDRVTGSIRRVLAWRRLWPRLAGVLCASDFVGRLLVDDGVPGHLLHVVPYPIVAPSAAVGPAEARNEVLYVGRINEQKGVHHLVSAFARLRERHAEARLLIAGGPSPQQLRPLIAERGIGDAVELLGWLDEPGLRRAYERARVLAFPSLWPEPFGMAGPEAMAHGLPVVASDVGGVSAWLAPGRGGSLVPPGDERALAEALTRFVGDPQLADREGMAGRKIVISQLGVERHLELLLPILERASS